MHVIFSGVIWWACTDVAYYRAGRLSRAGAKDEGVVIDFRARAVRISGSTSFEANYKDE